MLKTKVAVALLFVTVALTSCIYMLQAVFDESRYFPQNSLDYFLLVNSDYIRKFPLPTDAERVLYHSSCGDGPKAPSVAVQFSVRVIDDVYLKQVEKFVEVNRLVKIEEKGLFEPSTVYLDERGAELEFAYHPSD